MQPVPRDLSREAAQLQSQQGELIIAQGAQGVLDSCVVGAATAERDLPAVSEHQGHGL